MAYHQQEHLAGSICMPAELSSSVPRMSWEDGPHPRLNSFPSKEGKFYSLHLLLEGTGSALARSLSLLLAVQSLLWLCCDFIANLWRGFIPVFTCLLNHNMDAGDGWKVGL